LHGEELVGGAEEEGVFFHEGLFALG
jgi:hypothetical protein